MTTFIKSGLLLSATLIFAACGGGGGSSPSVVVSSAPVFTSPSSVMVQENTLTGFYLVSASDPNNDPLTFTLSGGADLSQFTLASDNQLTFITPPDFENPSDAGGNNVYEVEFAVNDGNNNPVTMLVSITVTDQAQEPVRNKDISFQNVAVTRDVLFKTVGATELRMDIFSPEGDTDTSRPVMIAAFGGGFIAGNRFNEDDSVRIARDFARRGYVAAAIDYRTAATGTPTEDELLRAIMIALQDAWAAVRFFREDANGPNIYGTNPNQIFVGGQSAGGVIGKNLAILDESDTETVSRFSSFIGSGGLYGDGATYDESRIQGALSISGATFGDAQDIIDAESSIVYSAHEELDPVVPCGTSTEGSTFTGLIVSGPCTTLPIFQGLGVPAELYLLESVAGHVDYTDAQYDEIFQGAADFFYENIIGINE